MSEKKTTRILVPRITSYAIPIDAFDDLTIEERKGLADGGGVVSRWAISTDRTSGVWTRERRGFVLEPIPSERDDEWIASARWASEEEAFAEVREHVIPWMEARRGS